MLSGQSSESLEKPRYPIEVRNASMSAWRSELKVACSPGYKSQNVSHSPLTPRSRREGNPQLRLPLLRRQCCDDELLPPLLSSCDRGDQESSSPRMGMIIVKIIGQWVFNPFSVLASTPNLKTAWARMIIAIGKVWQVHLPSVQERWRSLLLRI